MERLGQMTMCQDHANGRAYGRASLIDWERAAASGWPSLAAAALASAASFAVGAAMPLVVTAIGPPAHLIYLVSGTSLFFLALLGGIAARVGGAGVIAGAIRVTFWGALAMAVTGGVGALFGVAV